MAKAMYEKYIGKKMFNAEVKFNGVGVLFKILMNYLYYLSLIFTMRVEINPGFKSFMSTASDSMQSILFSVDCLIDDFY